MFYYSFGHNNIESQPHRNVQCHLKLPGLGRSIGHPSETHLKLKSREISFVHNICFSCSFALKIYPEHGSNTSVFCEKRQSYWITDKEVMGKRDFTRFHEIWGFGPWQLRCYVLCRRQHCSVNNWWDEYSHMLVHTYQMCLKNICTGIWFFFYIITIVIVVTIIITIVFIIMIILFLFYCYFLRRCHKYYYYISLLSSSSL